MSDYMKYIDSQAKRLGDLAYNLGDYESALMHYQKALGTLRNYSGDRMAPIMMGAEFAEKIKHIESMVGPGSRIGAKRSASHHKYWDLTKSAFVKGNQCLKYLYLDKYKKHEKPPISEEKRKLFSKGHAFEDLVRERQFPNGVNVKTTIKDFKYFRWYTIQMLSQPGPQTLYEATIIKNRVLVMCDVLLKDEDGNIDIYEIKMNSAINEAILADLAIQYTICKKQFGQQLRSFNVILRTAGDGQEWSIEELTAELDKQVGQVEEKIDTFKEALKGKEPDIAMGEQCTKPYACEFIDYCKGKPKSKPKQEDEDEYGWMADL